MNPNTIVSYLPQQYRHVIDGAFDALGMSTKAHGGFATREGEHVNDNYYYEEDFEDNIIHGTGTYTWTDRQKYIGDWENGKMKAPAQ